MIVAEARYFETTDNKAVSFTAGDKIYVVPAKGQGTLIAPNYVYEPMIDEGGFHDIDTGPLTLEAGYWHRFRRALHTEAHADQVFNMIYQPLMNTPGLTVATFSMKRQELATIDGSRSKYPFNPGCDYHRHVMWVIDVLYVVEDARRTPYWQRVEDDLPDDLDGFLQQCEALADNITVPPVDIARLGPHRVIGRMI